MKIQQFFLFFTVNRLGTKINILYQKERHRRNSGRKTKNEEEICCEIKQKKMHQLTKQIASRRTIMDADSPKLVEEI